MNTTHTNHKNRYPVTRITRTTSKGETYEVVIDAHDAHLYHQHRWQRHTKGLIRYAGKKKGQGSILLHRAILKLPPDLYVVFRNGNPLDVRRANMEVITYAEQRRRKKKNPSIRTMHQDRPTGVSFPVKVYRWSNGQETVYRQARACFCYRYKQSSKSFSIDVLGLEEAVRRALAWRVSMIREHGLEPNGALLDMLARATRMARAGGGFEEIYGGNAEYENNVVVGHESSFQVVGFDYRHAA